MKVAKTCTQQSSKFSNPQRLPRQVNAHLDGAFTARLCCFHQKDEPYL